MKIKRRWMEEDVKNINIKLKDMERHGVPSFPLDIKQFFLGHSRVFLLDF